MKRIDRRGLEFESRCVYRINSKEERRVVNAPNKLAAVGVGVEVGVGVGPPVGDTRT